MVARFLFWYSIRNPGGKKWGLREKSVRVQKKDTAPGEPGAVLLFADGVSGATGLSSLETVGGVSGGGRTAVRRAGGH